MTDKISPDNELAQVDENATINRIEPIHYNISKLTLDN